MLLTIIMAVGPCTSALFSETGFSPAAELCNCYDQHIGVVITITVTHVRLTYMYMEVCFMGQYKTHQSDVLDYKSAILSSVR